MEPIWNSRVNIISDKDMRELRAYRDLGTVLGLAVARAKREPKLVEITDDGEVYCPACGEQIPGYYANYCEHCGQHIERPDDFYE